MDQREPSVPERGSAQPGFGAGEYRLASTVHPRGGWLYATSSGPILRLRDGAAARALLTSGQGSSEAMATLRRVGVLRPVAGHAEAIRGLRARPGDREATRLVRAQSLGALAGGNIDIVVVSLRDETAFGDVQGTIAATDTVFAFAYGDAAAFVSLLSPPTTPCLQCLVTRIRSAFRFAEIDDLPLADLLEIGAPNNGPALSLARAFAGQALQTARYRESDDIPFRGYLLEFDVRGLTLRRQLLLPVPRCATCEQARQLSLVDNRGVASM